MGVDNSATLFLGLPEGEMQDELDRVFGNPTDVRDAVDEWAYKNNRRLETVFTNNEVLLVGFILADSGSYDWKEIPDLDSLQHDKRVEFAALFHKNPKCYIVERQW